MASDNEASCIADPNFAVICAFLQKFGTLCGVSCIDFIDLQKMIENTQELPQPLVDLHLKLLRRIKKTVHIERWELVLAKVCHSYNNQDGWEIEEFGYKNARVSCKLRTLKTLLEMQFDCHTKFKNEINKLSADELRSQPLGRDKLGHVYWYQIDEDCQIRIYKEDPGEETWLLIVQDRGGLVSMISHLRENDSIMIGIEPVLNEDSNSLEIEKPILDTGQTDSSSNQPTADDKTEEKVADEKIEEERLKKVEAEETAERNGAVESDDEEEPEVKNEDPPARPIRLRLKPMSELLNSPSAAKYQAEEEAKKKRTNNETVETSKPAKARKLTLMNSKPIKLTNKKHVEESSEEEEDSDDVSEEIVEPIIYVKGRGQGKDNCTANIRQGSEESSPIVAEENPEVDEDISDENGEEEELPKSIPKRKSDKLKVIHPPVKNVGRSRGKTAPPPVKIKKSTRADLRKERKKKKMESKILQEIEEKARHVSGVRQSRRLAKIKIGEAEKPKLKDLALAQVKCKSIKMVEKAEKNKNGKLASDKQHVALKKKKKKKKHKNEQWDSSSDSSLALKEALDDKEEISEDVISEDEKCSYHDFRQKELKSDHEFSPESDIEDGAEVKPLKRARTVRKEDKSEDDGKEQLDVTTNCEKCSKFNQPEWILLCDGCDHGWHCSCLRPALLVIPEGDWFCPSCQHATLLTKLEELLINLDKRRTKQQIDVRRKARLAYFNINSNNVLAGKDNDEVDRRNRARDRRNRNRNTKIRERYERNRNRESSCSSSTDSGSTYSGSTESDKPIYQLRERRKVHSYGFNDYDDLINSSIQDEESEWAASDLSIENDTTATNEPFDLEKELVATAAVKPSCANVDPKMMMKRLYVKMVQMPK